MKQNNSLNQRRAVKTISMEKTVSINQNSQSQALRLYLQEELTRRCYKNPRYSLRTFAMSLGIHAPTLSHILRGQRKITEKMSQLLIQALGLTPYQVQQIYHRQSTMGQDLQSFQQLQQDQFALISQWYHFAILELLQVKGFQKNPRWIAKSLGLTVSEVNIAMERLFRLKMILVREDGSWVSQAAHTTLGTEQTSLALRQLQKTYLEKSLQALAEVPVDQRDHSGMTMSVSASDLPAIKERIKKFRRELCEFVERHPSRDQVYQLSVSFFPLSRSMNQEVSHEDKN